MWYLSGALIFFIYGLVFFMKDKTTPKTHIMSWLVLIIASATWPLSAPLAIIELINKAKNKQNKDTSDVKMLHSKEITKTANSN